MTILARIKEFVMTPDDEATPKSPGCGRPVGQPGAVCADCSQEQTRRPGG